MGRLFGIVVVAFSCLCFSVYLLVMNNKESNSVSVSAIEKECLRHVSDGLPVAVKQLVNVVSEASLRYGLESELVFAVMTAESRCVVDARSQAGAVGLMQLMPKTARWLGVRNLLSVEENVFAGAKYLSYLLDKFDGDIQLTLAAYNAGPYTVKQYGGVPPYRETRAYVHKVLRYYERFHADVDYQLLLSAV